MSDSKPRILLHTLVIRPVAQNYFPKGWGPSIKYMLRGAIPSGSELITSFAKPDGSEWLTLTNGVNEQGEDGFVNVSASAVEDDLITTDVGAFPFKVRLVSELEGVDETLLEGKLTVEAVNAEKHVYRARNDWQIATGTVQLDLGSDADAPVLQATMWLGGGAEAHQLAGYLFFNGKKLFSSEVRGQLDISGGETAPHSDGNGGMSEFIFDATLAKGFVNGSYGNTENWHDLSKKPGKYEFKVTREKKLDRSLAFEVGEDGRLVQTGPIEPTLNGFRMHAKASVLGKADNLDPASQPAWYGGAAPESLSTLDQMYANKPAAEVAETGPSPELAALIEASAGKAETIAGWFWDDKFEQPVQAEAAIRYVDEVLPKLEQLVSEYSESVTFRGEQVSPATVREAMEELKARAQGTLDARASAQSDRAAPYRAVLAKDKLKVFNDRPAGDYRYYTSGKREIETPEELSEASAWYFEGIVDQGLITEKWTVKGYKFDASGKLLDRTEASGFGTNAPSSAFP